jgi:hypothetical protein
MRSGKRGVNPWERFAEADVRPEKRRDTTWEL